jgi:hypothetical protein
MGGEGVGMGSPEATGEPSPDPSAAPTPSIDFGQLLNSIAKGAMIGMSLGGIPGAVTGGVIGGVVSGVSQGDFGGEGTGEGGSHGGGDPDAAGPPDSTDQGQIGKKYMPPAPNPPVVEKPVQALLPGEVFKSIKPGETTEGTRKAEELRRQLRAKMGYWSARKTFGPAGPMDIFVPSLFKV